MDNRIVARRREKDGFFEVAWSALARGDRWSIARMVPAVGGVYEIYWMDEHKHLRLLSVASARFGGLRSELRRFTDPELVENPKISAVLADKDIYFRYSISDSADDMADVLWFFRKTYFPEEPGVSHSGRFQRIFLKESAPDQVRWVT